MNKLLLACVLFFGIISASSAWAAPEDICSSPDVVFCENWEDRPTGSSSGNAWPSLGGKTLGWTTSSNGADLQIVTNDKFDGTKSMMWTYPQNSAAGYFDSNTLPGAPAEFYVRFWVKNSGNWVWSNNGQKLLFLDDYTARFLMWDQAAPVASDLIDRPIGLSQWASPEFQLRQTNGPTFHWPLNEWVCTEMHVKMNSSTIASDGSFEGWIQAPSYNGGATTLVYTATGLKWVSNSGWSTLLRAISFSGFWNCGNVDTQEQPPCTAGNGDHPEMYRWIDNIVVGTQRIGCLGSVPPPDTTPPAAPTGVMVTMLAATMIFGGLYGTLTANRVPVHRLALGDHSADSATLRTVAVHGSASGADAMYAVLVANRAGTAEAAVLAPPAPAADAKSDTKGTI